MIWLLLLIAALITAIAVLIGVEIRDTRRYRRGQPRPSEYGPRFLEMSRCFGPAVAAHRRELRLTMLTEPANFAELMRRAGMDDIEEADL